jgi:hypothetical protein
MFLDQLRLMFLDQLRLMFRLFLFRLFLDQFHRMFHLFLLGLMDLVDYFELFQLLPAQLLE